LGKRQSRAAHDFAMSDFSLTLVLCLKTSKIINGMAKVQIKSERITPFGGNRTVSYPDSALTLARARTPDNLNLPNCLYTKNFCNFFQSYEKRL
jgi:hypothetical protein